MKYRALEDLLSKNKTLFSLDWNSIDSDESLELIEGFDFEENNDLVYYDGPLVELNRIGDYYYFGYFADEVKGNWSEECRHYVDAMDRWIFGKVTREEILSSVEGKIKEYDLFSIRETLVVDYFYTNNFLSVARIVNPELIDQKILNRENLLNPYLHEPILEVIKGKEKSNGL